MPHTYTQHQPQKPVSETRKLSDVSPHTVPLVSAAAHHQPTAPTGFFMPVAADIPSGESAVPPVYDYFSNLAEQSVRTTFTSVGQFDVF